MSALSDAAEHYLRLRRSLGHDLKGDSYRLKGKGKEVMGTESTR